MIYFWDSSAVYEYMKDNPAVIRYFEPPNEGVVSLLVVLETYFILLKKLNKEAAEKALTMLFPIIAAPSETIVKNAMKFRLENEKLGFSYADALGYTYAKEHNMQFLTCDNAFKSLPGVVLLR